MEQNGVVTVQEAANWLKMDAQTVRLLLQQGLVSWGICYKRTPRSRQYSYLIYLNKFSEETGYNRKDVKENE
jgi:hypothetical protein